MNKLTSFLAEVVQYYVLGVIMAVIAIGTYVQEAQSLMIVMICASGIFLVGATTAIIYQTVTCFAFGMIGFWPSRILRRIFIGIGYVAILALVIRSVNLIRWSDEIVSWRSLLIANCAVFIASLIAGIVQGLHEAGEEEQIIVGNAD